MHCFGDRAVCLLIALIGIVMGLGVSGGAEVLGRATTSSVVTCIGAIIAADTLVILLLWGAGMAVSPIIVSDLMGGYNGTPVIHGCNMEIGHGEIVVIMGGSGSGKSTFLRHLIGLKEPMQGDVSLFGESLYGVSENERLKLLKGIGVAFQSGALLSSLTVGQNVALPLVEHSDLDRETIDIIVRMKLDFVGLLGKEDLLPSNCQAVC